MRDFSVFNLNEDGESDGSAEEEEIVDPVVAFLDSLRLSEYAPLFLVSVLRSLGIAILKVFC